MHEYLEPFIFDHMLYAASPIVCMTNIYVSMMHDRMIQKLSIKNPEETFSQVAHEIFNDGIYNWGRVVTLFYFAYKMIIRVNTILLAVNSSLSEYFVKSRAFCFIAV